MSVVQNIVISVFILAGGVAGLFVLGQKPEVPTQDRRSDDEGVAVVTAKVAEWNQPFHINVDGEAVTYRVVTVGTEVAGRIVTKTDAARGGTYVQKGDLLFEIDSTNYRLEVNRLQAQLRQIDEEVKAIAVDAENTVELMTLVEEDWQLQKNQLARMKELRNRGTANESELEAAMKEELVGRNSLQTLRNQQRSLIQQVSTKQAGRDLVETELERAEADLQRCQVVSPLEDASSKMRSKRATTSKPAKCWCISATGVVWKSRPSCGRKSWRGCGSSVVSVTWPVATLTAMTIPSAFQKSPAKWVTNSKAWKRSGTAILLASKAPAWIAIRGRFPVEFWSRNHGRRDSTTASGGRATVSPPGLLSGMFLNVRIPVESPLQLLSLPLEAVRPGGQIWVNR